MKKEPIAYIERTICSEILFLCEPQYLLTKNGYKNSFKKNIKKKISGVVKQLTKRNSTKNKIYTFL
jgi:hypothetical protein